MEEIDALWSRGKLARAGVRFGIRFDGSIHVEFCYEGRGVQREEDEEAEGVQHGGDRRSLVAGEACSCWR